MSAGDVSLSQTDSASEISLLLRSAETVAGKHIETTADFMDAMRAIGTAQDAKTKKLRRQIDVLKLELDRKDAELAKYEIEVNGLKLANENSNRKISKLTSEIRSLKRQASPERPAAGVGDKVDEVMNMFDEIIAQQAKEISQLSKQRDVLIQSVNSLDKMCRSYEDQISGMEKEAQNTSDFVDRVKSRLEETEGEIATLAKEVVDITGIEMETHEQSYTYVLRAARELMSRERVEVSVEPVKEDDTGKLAILGELEAAVKFMQELVMGGEGESSVEDSYLAANESVKSALLTQCARMDRFIDDNLSALGESRLPETASLFRPSSVNGPDIKLSEYFCFVTEEELKAPAMRELFALLVGVVQVNHIISGHMEYLKVKGSAKKQDEEPDEWKLEIQEQIQMAASEIRRNGGQVDDEGDVIPWLVSAWNEKQQDNKELEETLQQLHDTQNVTLKDGTIAVDKNEIQAFRNQLDALEADIVKEKKAGERAKKALEGKVKKLEQEKKDLEAQLKKFKNGAKDYKAKYKQSAQELADTTRLFQEVQATVNNVVKEKAALENTVADLKQTIKKQGDQMLLLVSKERRLKSNKERLEERIQALEAQNKRAFTDIKSSNETLKQQYEATITNLKNDLDDALVSLDREKQERQKVLAEKQSIQTEITKLRVSERALKIKLTSLEDRQNIERSAQNAKTSSYVMSVNALTGRKVEEANNRIEAVRNWLASTLDQSFHLNFPTDLSLEALFEMLQEQVTTSVINERVLADALEIRKRLNVPKSVALSSIVTSIQREVTVHKERLDEAQVEISRLQKQIADCSGDMRFSLSRSE